MGPQTILFAVNIPIFGRYRSVFTLTPEEPFLQKVLIVRAGVRIHIHEAQAGTDIDTDIIDS